MDIAVNHTAYVCVINIFDI